MMKRILSLVLALLTLALPVCAMGEASRLDVTDLHIGGLFVGDLLQDQRGDAGFRVKNRNILHLITSFFLL